MANQYTTGSYTNQRSLVAEYLALHPLSLTAEIARGMEMDPRRISHLLFVLREEGRAIGVRQGGTKALFWRLTEDEQQLNEGSPIRIIVKHWSDRPKRDDWTTLFYGAKA